MDDDALDLLLDPFKLLATCWPDVRIYDRQADIIESVRDNKITVVPAGNMLGKDFIAGFIIVWFFLSHPRCRIITTSAKDDHLDVLWSELRNFIRSSAYPLLLEKGGPLKVNQREITKVGDEISYVKGMVASDQTVAAMGGHHAEYTLFVADEASSVNDAYWDIVQGWMKKALIIGNTWPCQNFFKHAIKGKPGSNDYGGDIESPSGRGYYRKIIQIKASDNPNVRLGLMEKARGKEPSNRVLIPGVKTYSEYTENRLLWDPIHQSVALDAEFYEGDDVMLYPLEWRRRAQEIAISLLTGIRRARTMGVDGGEGRSKSVWTICDWHGIIKQHSLITKDTSVIPGITLGFMREYKLDPEDILFDRGGGGKQYADLLRSQGYPVRTIGFGSQATAENPPHMASRKYKTGEKERKYTYLNRRAEMFGLLRKILNPAETPAGFGIPSEYQELHRQLAPLPLLYDDEGRMWLYKKDKKDPNKKEITLKELLGCSPDEADSLVLAVFGLYHPDKKRVLGAA